MNSRKIIRKKMVFYGNEKNPAASSAAAGYGLQEYGCHMVGESGQGIVSPAQAPFIKHCSFP